MFNYYLLGGLQRGSKLFEDCLNKLSAYDPSWTREKILHFIDNMNYNCFICVNSNDLSNMVGAIAFNPDKQEDVIKAFLVYVVEELRRQGIGAVMVSEFIIWAIREGFTGAQIGLGNSPELVSLLCYVEELKELLLREYESFVDIEPETGVVWFRF
jgi:GNAT superfamily N-acetyltransferase